MIWKRIGLIAIVLIVSGIGYLAYPRVAYKFVAFDDAQQIMYEPGAEDLARLVAENMTSSLEKVRQAQYVPFNNPAAIKVYVFNDVDRYARFSRASSKTRGSSTTDEIYLSARLRDKIETLPGILTHELSHVHIRQYTGTWKYIKDIPGWFLEGMAVLVSSGAGAESVTAEEALQKLKTASSIVFEDRGRIIGHKTAHDYQLKPHMYYRLASLYVQYLHDVDPKAFEATYTQMLQQSSLHDAWSKHYAKPNIELWSTFVSSVN